MKRRAMVLFMSVVMVTGCLHRFENVAQFEAACRLAGGSWTVVGRDNAGEEEWDCVNPRTGPGGAASTTDAASGGDAGAGSADADDVRDPGAARSRAVFFPGGGHFYSGESTRGAMLLAGSAGALVAGVLLSSGKGSCDTTGPDPNCVYNPKTHMDEGKPANRTPMLIGSSAALLLWGYGIIDAPKSAERANSRSRFRIGSAQLFPEPVLGLDRDGSPEAGLRLRVAW